MEATDSNIHEFSIRELLKASSNFKLAKRIDYRNYEPSLLEEEVFGKGLPLVISNTTVSWKRDRELFSFDWLKKNFGKLLIKPKDCATHRELSTSWTLIEYLDYLNLPKEKRNPSRAYGKEVTCPTQWNEFISQKMPEFAAKGENDLMAENLKELRADTTTVSIGGDDTLLPGRIEHLSTLGNNLMVYGDEDAYALWMVVSSTDKDKAVNFWKKSNGSLYSENLFLSVDQLSKAPFTVYILEQRPGDFVITPSGSPYQLINKSIKVAWNSIPYQIIQNCYDALPMYRSLGKPEALKIRAIAYYSLLHRIDAASAKTSDTLVDEFPPLLSIVEDLIHSEWIDLEDDDDDEESDIEVLKFKNDDVSHQRTCDFCKADIWNRCYHCTKCGPSGYDICLACVAEGRACQHREDMNLTEYISMEKIQQTFDRAQEAYQKLVKSAKRKKNKKRKIVEWKPQSSSGSSTGTLAYNLVVMYKAKETAAVCHQCEKAQPYNIAIPVHCEATKGKKKCELVYCTKCLWNRYAQRLIDCLLDEDWECPSCKGSCNCQACLDKRGVTECSTDDIAGYSEALEANYPFQSLGQPNVPAPSDFKPVFQAYALKKRKFPMPSSSYSKFPTMDTPMEEVKPVEVKKEPKIESTKPEPIVEVPKQEPVRPTQPVVEESKRPSNQFQSGFEASNYTWNSNTSNQYENTRPPSSQDIYSMSTSQNSQPQSLSQLEWKDSYGRHEVDHKTTILVRNLSYNCTSEDLGELFKVCGPIEQITIPLDKGTNKLRGYGFVKFKRLDDAEVAMRKFHNFMMKDRALELEWSIDKNSRRSAEGRLTNSICFKCNKEGHYFRNCPELEPDFDRDRKIRDWEDYERERDRMGIKDRDGKRELRGYICFKCGKEGHVAQDCKSDTGGPGFKGVICFKCGIGGHLANKCDKRIRGCYLCGKDGHIASECNEKDIPPERFLQDRQEERQDDKEDRYNTPMSDEQWESTQKYRRVMSPENKDSVRAPSKDSQFVSGWDDRERGRDRKTSGWDDRYKSYGSMDKSSNAHETQYNDRDPRLNGNRDPRYSSSSPNSVRDDRYHSSNVDNYNGVSKSYSSEDTYRTQYSSVPTSTTYPNQASTLPYYNGADSKPTTPPPLSYNQQPNWKPSPLGTQPFLNAVSPQPQYAIPQYNLVQPNQPITQPIPQQTTSQQAPQQDSEEVAEKKRKLKSQCTNMVVSRLSKYFNSGQISSKDDFKQLSRKIIHEFVNGEGPHYVVDKSTDGKIRKQVDQFFLTYQSYKTDKNPATLDQWLQSM